MSETQEQTIENPEQDSIETVDTPTDTSQEQLDLAAAVVTDTPAGIPEEPSTPEEPEAEAQPDPEESETQEEAEEEGEGYELFGRQYKSEEAAEQSLEEKGKYLNEKQSELDKLRNELEEKQAAFEKRLEDLQRTQNLVSPEQADAGKAFMDFYKDKPELQKELIDVLRRQGHPQIGAAGVYSDDPAVREMQTQLEHQQNELLRLNRKEAVQKFRTDNSLSEGQMDQIVARADELAHDHFSRTGVNVDIPFEVARKTLQADSIPTLIAKVERATEERVRAEVSRGRKAKSAGAGGQVTNGKVDTGNLTQDEKLKAQLELAAKVVQ